MMTALASLRVAVGPRALQVMSVTALLFCARDAAAQGAPPPTPRASGAGLLAGLGVSAGVAQSGVSASRDEAAPSGFGAGFGVYGRIGVETPHGWGAAFEPGLFFAGTAVAATLQTQHLVVVHRRVGPLVFAGGGGVALGWSSAPLAEQRMPVGPAAVLRVSMLPSLGARRLGFQPGMEARLGVVDGQHTALIGVTVAWGL
jgi:hypothetical protein